MLKSISPRYFLGAKGKLCFIEYLLGVSHYRRWYLLNLSITNSAGITIILNSESSKLRLNRHSAVLLQRHISVTRESLYRIHACLTLLPIPFYIADQIIYAWIFPLESHSARPQNLLLRIQGIMADCKAAFSVESVDFPGCALTWQLHVLLSVQFSSKMENAITVFSKILLLVQKIIKHLIKSLFYQAGCNDSPGLHHGKARTAQKGCTCVCQGECLSRG